MPDRTRIIQPQITIKTAWMPEHCGRACPWAIADHAGCGLFGRLRTELAAPGMYHRLDECRRAEFED